MNQYPTVLDAHSQFELQCEVTQIEFQCLFCENYITDIHRCVNHVLEHITKGPDKLLHALILEFLFSSLDTVDIKLNRLEPQIILTPVAPIRSVIPLRDKFQIPLEPISRLKCPNCEQYPYSSTVLQHFVHCFGLPDAEASYFKIWLKRVYKMSGPELRAKYAQYRKKISVLNRSNCLLANANLDDQVHCKRNCGFTASIPEMFRHYAIAHPISMCNAQWWYCVICNQRTETGDALVRHFWESHVGCLCRRKFKNFHSLYKHHCEKTAGMCPICWKPRFQDEEQMNMHLLSCEPWKAAAREEEFSIEVELDFDEIKEQLDEKVRNRVLNYFANADKENEQTIKADRLKF